MSAGSRLQPRSSTECWIKRWRARRWRAKVGDVEQSSAEFVATRRRVLFMPLYEQHRRTLFGQATLFSLNCPRWKKAAYIQRFAASVELLRWLPCTNFHAFARAGHPNATVRSGSVIFCASKQRRKRRGIYAASRCSQCCPSSSCRPGDHPDNRPNNLWGLLTLSSRCAGNRSSQATRGARQSCGHQRAVLCTDQSVSAIALVLRESLAGQSRFDRSESASSVSATSRAASRATRKRRSGGSDVSRNNGVG